MAFRILLGGLLFAVVAYTVPVLLNHGPNLFPVFFGDIAEGTWRGQFNVDFMGFLVLSAVWVAWRHGFKPLGLLLAAPAFLGGIPFLTTYLLIVSFQANGNMKVIMLGSSRAV
ncbi:MAG: hypothetical protein ACPG06_03575 [Alphaproteobacteria bacterium]